ncbi:MAG: hypothetical protein ACRD4Y_09575, partial [Candidatus Acidiferrales bacterium]
QAHPKLVKNVFTAVQVVTALSGIFDEGASEPLLPLEQAGEAALEGEAAEGAAAEAGQAAEGAATDANKLNHIFGNSQHGLDGIVKGLGSQQAAFNALQQATEAAVEKQGLTGVFETTVQVAGETVTVRGNVIGGIVKIGTAFK